MSSTLQKPILKALHLAGKGVEKAAFIIKKAEKKFPFTKIKKSLGKKTQNKPTGLEDKQGQDFARIDWEEEQLQRLLSQAEEEYILRLMPNLEGKCVLLLSTAPNDYAKNIQSKNPLSFLEIDVRKNPPDNIHPSVPNHPIILASIQQLPLHPQSADLILFPSALAWRKDLNQVLHEATRILKKNGRLILSTVHPYFEYLLQPREGFLRSLSELHQEFQKYGFFVDQINEASVSAMLNQLKLPRSLKEKLKGFPGLPVVLLMRGILIKKEEK
ncbi:MAG: methyltransferase domain-containing protein [Deltaproteobacteria bacterium]|nr:methyltransferase domain-containing protein [Deltaproteobacteria bacterium]